MKKSLLLSVFSVLFALRSIQAEESKLLPPGAAAPTFSLPALSGERVALSAYCGQTLSKPIVNKLRHTVILSFWATYCKPCQKEIPQLTVFGEKHKADNVLVLCISVDKEGEAAVAPFVKEKGYTAPVLLDPYMKTSERYGVKSLPALFIIDTLGVIRYCSQGFDEKSNFGDKLERLFTAIKAGKITAKAPEIAGSEVAIKGDTATANKEKAAAGPIQSHPKISPHKRWSAIAKVECGEPVEKVASEVGVSVDELRKWHEDLKQAAMKLWSAAEK